MILIEHNVIYVIKSFLEVHFEKELLKKENVELCLLALACLKLYSRISETI